MFLTVLVCTTLPTQHQDFIEGVRSVCGWLPSRFRLSYHSIPPSLAFLRTGIDYRYQPTILGHEFRFSYHIRNIPPEGKQPDHPHKESDYRQCGSIPFHSTYHQPPLSRNPVKQSRQRNTKVSISSTASLSPITPPRIHLLPFYCRVPTSQSYLPTSGIPIWPLIIHSQAMPTPTNPPLHPTSSIKSPMRDTNLHVRTNLCHATPQKTSPYSMEAYYRNAIHTHAHSQMHFPSPPFHLSRLRPLPPPSQRPPFRTLFPPTISDSLSRPINLLPYSYR